MRSSPSESSAKLADDDCAHDEPESFMDFGFDESTSFEEEEHQRKRKDVEHGPLVHGVDQSSMCNMSSGNCGPEPEPPLQKNGGRRHHEETGPCQQSERVMLVLPKLDAEVKDAK